jgi:hypothetical protein
MVDLGQWAAPGAGLVAAALAVINMITVVPLYMRHRHRLQMEREVSARTRDRTDRLTEALRARRTVRLHERDSDGERLIEIGLGRSDDDRAAA